MGLQLYHLLQVGEASFRHCAMQRFLHIGANCSARRCPFTAHADTALHAAEASGHYANESEQLVSALDGWLAALSLLSDEIVEALREDE